MRCCLARCALLTPLFLALSARAEESTPFLGYTVRLVLSSEDFAPSASEEKEICAAWQRALMPGGGPWGFGVARTVLCGSGGEEGSQNRVVKIGIGADSVEIRFCTNAAGSERCGAASKFPHGNRPARLLADGEIVELAIARILDGETLVSLAHPGLRLQGGEQADGPEKPSTSLPQWVAPLLPVQVRLSTKKNILVVKKMPPDAPKGGDGDWLAVRKTGLLKSSLAQALTRAVKRKLHSYSLEEKAAVVSPTPSRFSGLLRLQGGGFSGGLLDLPERQWGWRVEGSMAWAEMLFAAMDFRGVSLRASLLQPLGSGSADPMGNLQLNHTRRQITGLLGISSRFSRVLVRVGLSSAWIREETLWKRLSAGDEILPDARLSIPVVWGGRSEFLWEVSTAWEVRLEGEWRKAQSHGFSGWGAQISGTWWPSLVGPGQLPGRSLRLGATSFMALEATSRSYRSGSGNFEFGLEVPLTSLLLGAGIEASL